MTIIWCDILTVQKRKHNKVSKSNNKTVGTIYQFSPHQWAHLTC